MACAERLVLFRDTLQAVGHKYPLHPKPQRQTLTIPQVAVERTKPNGRIVGIDIIPAQPPKGVSTIQGNFLSPGVREEVKQFLSDPDRGRPKQQLFSSIEDEGNGTTAVSVSEQDMSYIDLERHANDDSTEEPGSNIANKRGRKSKEEEGRMVDVVLSDMSAPWEQTTGFWKRSLSDPYRMMNTSGINFKDHAGSMVWHSRFSTCGSILTDLGSGSLCRGTPIRT